MNRIYNSKIGQNAMFDQGKMLRVKKGRHRLEGRLTTNVELSSTSNFIAPHPCSEDSSLAVLC
jgi:hypothetical protein